jgi:hypothetical protein
MRKMPAIDPIVTSAILPSVYAVDVVPDVVAGVGTVVLEDVVARVVLTWLVVAGEETAEVDIASAVSTGPVSFLMSKASRTAGRKRVERKEISQ